jgi:hypothetical protein
MTKNGGKRRRRQFRTFDTNQGPNPSDDSDSQSNSSYDGNISDDNSPTNSGMDLSMGQHSSAQSRSRSNSITSMNVNANSFTPNYGADHSRNLTATAQTYTPSLNPYSHCDTSSNGGLIEITPTKVSPEDIYEYQRLPSGVVITTSSGQQVEFWERVHVPDSQKAYSNSVQAHWDNRGHPQQWQ